MAHDTDGSNRLHREAQVMEALRSDFPDRSIWRSRRGDYWVATLMDDEGGHTPTIICDDPDGLRKALTADTRNTDTPKADS